MGTTREIRTVLVVDDDEKMLAAVHRKLRSNHVVLTATNSIKAQQLARDNRFDLDLALIDLRLSGESGVELVHKLKAQHPDLTMVCFSSFLSTAVVVDAMKAGAADVVAKTEPLADVLRRLRGGAARSSLDRVMSVEDVEWEHLQRVLLECGGSKQKAAEALGMFRSAFQRKIQKHERRLAGGPPSTRRRTTRTPRGGGGRARVTSDLTAIRSGSRRARAAATPTAKTRASALTLRRRSWSRGSVPPHRRWRSLPHLVCPRPSK